LRLAALVTGNRRPLVARRAGQHGSGGIFRGQQVTSNMMIILRDVTARTALLGPCLTDPTAGHGTEGRSCGFSGIKRLGRAECALQHLRQPGYSIMKVLYPGSIGGRARISQAKVPVPLYPAPILAKPGPAPVASPDHRWSCGRSAAQSKPYSAFPYAVGQELSSGHSRAYNHVRYVPARCRLAAEIA
jgi:hypothetical protein